MYSHFNKNSTFKFSSSSVYCFLSLLIQSTVICLFYKQKQVSNFTFMWMWMSLLLEVVCELVSEWPGISQSAKKLDDTVRNPAEERFCQSVQLITRLPLSSVDVKRSLSFTSATLIRLHCIMLKHRDTFIIFFSVWVIFYRWGSQLMSE